MIAGHEYPTPHPKGRLVGTSMDEYSYHSYVLRLWQEEAGGKSSWRFVLLNPISGEQWGFASLERLVAFLKGQMDESSPPGSVDRKEKGK